MQPWQAADFCALDPAWRKLAGHDVKAQVQRAWIERPRGHGKTSDMAAQIAWILLFAKRRVEGLAAAADRDQATLIHNAVERLAKANPHLFKPLQFVKHEIRNRDTGSRLQVISSDVGSSWGALPHFVICDELCHWEKPDLWHSLLSSAAKQANGVLAVLTNAGVGRGWQWDVREAARRNAESKTPSWHFSTLAGTQAPWLSEEHLEEQRQLLPAPIYERLWQNIWQHSDGDFVTLAEAEACRDASLTKQTHGRPGQHYFAAVDYAEKRDFTAAVVLHRELSNDGQTHLVVDRMDVAVPSPRQPVELSWVEQWMEEVAAGFHSVTFILDEWQLLGVIQSKQSVWDIRRFEFAGGKGNHALAVTLQKLILHRRVHWYPGCGQRTDIEFRDDLETELASLLLRQTSRAMCRIDHHPDGKLHDDRAFALGAACLIALEQDTATEWLSITPPTMDGGFAM